MFAHHYPAVNGNGIDHAQVAMCRYFAHHRRLRRKGVRSPSSATGKSPMPSPNNTNVFILPIVLIAHECSQIGLISNPFANPIHGSIKYIVNASIDIARKYI